MRELFIGLLEKVIGGVAILLSIGLVIAFLSSLVGGSGMAVNGQSAGVFTSFLLLIFGFVWIVFVVGFAYLGLGIYHNTKRTVELLEQQGR